MKPHFIALSFLAAVTIAAPVVSDTSLVSTAHAADKSGSFRGKASGGVKVKTSGGKTTVTLSGNFRTRSAPDLYVAVGGANPSSARRIGKLRKFKGGQAYSTSRKSFTHVHIYCKKYSVNYGSARLR